MNSRKPCSFPTIMRIGALAAVAALGCGGSGSNSSGAAAPTSATVGGETSEGQTSAAASAGECDLVCAGAQVESAPDETPDHHRAAVENANAVLASMHDDLLACYRARAKVNPNAHGFITLDIVLEPTGAVRTVETSGGASLGQPAMRCIVDRIRKAQFSPVHGGGTLRIHAPFTLRRVGVNETI